jgi:type IV secretion system protein TrbE
MDIVSIAAGAALGAAGVTFALRRPEKPDRGLPERLNWGALVDERGGEGEARQAIIEQKDGSVLAGWRYFGPDLDADTESGANLLIQQVNHGLLPFVDQWMIHVDAVQVEASGYAPEGAFPDAVTALIDEERRRDYEHSGQSYETEHYLVVTWLPPRDVYSRVGELVISRPERESADVGFANLLDRFAESLRKWEERWPSSVKLERLDAEALLAHLHGCLTGKRHPVALPEDASDLAEYLVGEEHVWTGFEPVVGTRHVRVVEFSRFPLQARPGMLSELTRMGFRFRFSSRLIPLSEAEALRQIRWQTKGHERRQKRLFQQFKDAETPGPEKDPAQNFHVDQHAVEMAMDSARAAALASSGSVRFCYYTPVLVIMEESRERADRIATELARTLNRKGFTCSTAGINAMSAFVDSLPGHGQYNVRKPLIHSRNIARLLPLTSRWSGPRDNPCRFYPPNSPPLLWGKTDGCVPLRVGTHIDPPDVGHHLIVAPTGMGKSFLLNMMLAQFRRYPRARVRYIDNGYSGYALCRAVGGTHYDLCSGRTDAICFQPLRWIDSEADRAKAERWLSVVFDVQGIRMEPELQEAIRTSLLLLARMPTSERTLTTLFYQLQNDRLRSALGYYCADFGNFGQLLDAGHDDLAGGDYQVFELKHLLRFADARISVPVFAYLFAGIERGFDGSPTYIAVDEGKMAMGDGLFARQLAEWSITVRKDNVMIALATQDPSDLASSPHRAQLMESYPVHFFLPNPRMTEEGVAQYRNMGLNEREIAIVRGARPQREIYYKTPRGSRLFDLGAGPLARAILGGVEGRSNQELRAEIDALIARDGDTWPAAWLRQRGLEGWAEAFTRRHRKETSHEDQLELEALLSV